MKGIVCRVIGLLRTSVVSNFFYFFIFKKRQNRNCFFSISTFCLTLLLVIRLVFNEVYTNTLDYK